MISISGISKSFRENEVLKDISLDIDDRLVYGLIGYNGAGKTTLLKIISGIYRHDIGSVCIDGAPVYENEKTKMRIFMMTEELFFMPQSTLTDMEKFYSGYYPGWNRSVFYELMELFGLRADQKVRGFSKGMQRQAGIMTAFATGAEYLLLDEAFDGLDLGVRKTMRKLLRSYVADRQATVVITSHNLQELEECTDRFGMISDGRLVCDMSVREIQDRGSSLEEYFLQGKEPVDNDWNDIFKQ